jgi:hypothetical protein
MRRLAWPLLAAAILVLAITASSLARVQTRHVVVVKGRGFSELAWDARDRDKSLCFLIKSGKHSSSVCAQKIPPNGVSTTSFQDNKRTFTVVGGVTTKKIKKVRVVFFDGKQLTVKTKAGRAYKGRRRGKIRFWAVKRVSPSPLRAVLPVSS